MSSDLLGFLWQEVVIQPEGRGGEWGGARPAESVHHRSKDTSLIFPGYFLALLFKDVML